jgi:hypothetical protein
LAQLAQRYSISHPLSDVHEHKRKTRSAAEDLTDDLMPL